MSDIATEANGHFLSILALDRPDVAAVFRANADKYAAILPMPMSGPSLEMPRRTLEGLRDGKFFIDRFWFILPRVKTRQEADELLWWWNDKLVKGCGAKMFWVLGNEPELTLVSVEFEHVAGYEYTESILEQMGYAYRDAYEESAASLYPNQTLTPDTP